MMMIAPGRYEQSLVTITLGYFEAQQVNIKFTGFI
jgi:hypothetical protein